MYFNGTKCYVLALGCFLSLSATAKDAAKVTKGGGLQKPLSFIENKGQLVDLNNKPLSNVQYKLSAPGMNMLVGSGQLHYQFRKVESKSKDHNNLATYRVDMSLLGANRNAEIVASDEQAYYENYYLPQTGGNGLIAHSWNRVTYKNVYPNIDWVLYVKDSKVEYDFVVHAGGNVNDIKLKYDGATAMKVDGDGGLSVNTPFGNIKEHTPKAYDPQTGKTIASAFNLKGHTVSFHTDAHEGAIVIDPYLSWSTYYGGTLEDEVTGIREDASNVTYVCGFTSSGSGIATVGAYRGYTGSPFDMFMAKFSATGALSYATYFGGTGNDEATSIALDNGASPSIYVGGFTTSPTGGPGSFASFGAYQAALGGGIDGFLIKFNNAGSRTWCTFFGGSGNDFVYGVTSDASGANVYITGQTTSGTAIATGGAYQMTLVGAADAFLAKFSAGGGIQWSTYYGGVAQSQGNGVNCDVLGNINIVGQSNASLNIASAGAYQTSLAGSYDAFVAQFNSAGSRIWGTYFGGAGTEQGNGISSDGAGNIAIVGNTTSTSGIASAKAFQPLSGGAQDAFVALFYNDGSLNWSSYYGGGAVDYGQAVCFDRLGNVVIAGATFSGSGIATTNSLQPAIGGDYDAYVAKINPLGQPLWNTYFGGTFYDYANGIAVDQNNQLAIGGYTTSNGNYGSGGIATATAHQTVNAGGVYDAFVSKFDVDTMVVIPQPYSDLLVCSGGQLNVPFTIYPVSASFQPGNVFSVELSDATGSFAAPTVIGSLPATDNSLPVPCTIPVLASGPNYRIRVTSTNPAFTSPDDYYDINIVASIAASTATATTPACVGPSNTISLFDAAPYSIANWSWTGPAGSFFTSTLQNPVITGITLGNAGVYSVTVTHNGCPSSTSTVSVVVNTTIPPTPTDSFALACAGGNLNLYANSDTTATVTYYWTGPAGFTSTVQNPTVTGITSAYSGFYALVDTLAGCPSVAVSFSVTVHPSIPVTASIIASPAPLAGSTTDIICSGTMVNFMAAVVNGGSAPTYQWFAGGAPVVGAVSSTWASSSLDNGEVVYCQISSNEICPSPAQAPSNAITMNVIDNAPLVYIAAHPGAHVTPGTSVTFVSSIYNGGTAPHLQWQLNGVNVPGATDSTFTVTAVNTPDTVSLTVVSNMMCPGVDSTGISNMVIAESNVGVTQISQALSAIGLFPNPNNGNFTIKGALQNNSSAVSYEVTDLLGRIIVSGEMPTTGNELNKTVSLSDMASGIYLLRLSQDGQNKILRFSVQR